MSTPNGLAEVEDALRRAGEAVARARNIDLVCRDGPEAQTRLIMIALNEVHQAWSYLIRTGVGR